jgi:hypothetical protein
MRRTAGTKELPPVRNTRSTSRSVICDEASARSSASSISPSSGAIQRSNSARVTVASISNPGPRKRNGALSSRDYASFVS